MANLLFDKPDTARMVNWGEPPAEVGSIRLEAPLGWEDTPEIMADRQSVADGMAAAGASRSLAAELWADVIRATDQPVRTTEADAWTELRRIWGSQAESKVAQARTAIAQMQVSYPRTTEYLERFGLGNDVAFIRKIVAGIGRSRK